MIEELESYGDYHSSDSSSIKIVVVGNEGVGKTSFVQHLIGSGRTSHVEPILCSARGERNNDESECAVSLAIYEWHLPPDHCSIRFKAMLWDFTTSKPCFQSIPEILFTPQTLFVVVWDMAAKEIEPMEHQRACSMNMNSSCKGEDPEATTNDPPDMPPPSLFGGGIVNQDSRRRSSINSMSAFKLGYDSDSDSDDDCDMDLYNQEEIRKAKRSLDQNIDQKVQSWIDRIQAKVPGATIVPVATFADQFGAASSQSSCDSNYKEARKRCRSLRERLLCNEEGRVHDLKQKVNSCCTKNGCDLETCRWVKSLNNRPKLLFCHDQDDDQALPHSVSSASEGTGYEDFRSFLLSSASSLRLDHQSSTTQQSFVEMKDLLQDSCRNMRKFFKIVQAEYFTKQYSNHELDREHKSQDFIRTALQALHLEGEIAYFGGVHGEKYLDFVVLDPTWLVESVDYILGAGAGYQSSTLKLDGVDCPSIERKEILHMWKDRFCTEQSLELVEQISADPSVQVFEFLESVLIQHNVFVPFAFNKAPSTGRYFLPNLLGQEGSDSLVYSLSELAASGILENSFCHGLVFLDSIPLSFVERILAYSVRSLDEYICTRESGRPMVTVKQLYCRKYSFRIKLGMTIHGNEERSVEVHSFFLQSSSDDVSSCPMACCQNIYVTCIQGCMDAQSCKAWKEIFLILRKGMQIALDEMPGLEYKSVGVCPECLAKKSVNEVGTWSFAKIKCILNDSEAMIRCRHGHCVDTKTVRGLVQCQLDAPVRDTACCVEHCNTKAADACSVSPPTELCFPAKLLTSANTSIDPCDLSKPSESISVVDVSVAPSLPESLFTMPAVSPANGELVETCCKNNETMLQVNELVEKCEASMKKQFFVRKKAHLGLNNLSLTENQIPIKDLYQTQLGINLQSLSLANNRLESIPSKLVLCLPNLKTLDLSHSFIYNLPKKWSLPKLKRLNLSHNLLISFPEESMLLGLLELEELDLSGNKLKIINLSPRTEVLRKLKVLDLSMNELTTLPDELGRLSALKIFDVQHNPIQEVPPDIVSAMNSFLLDAVKRSHKRSVKKGYPCDRREGTKQGRIWGSGSLSRSNNSSGASSQKRLSLTKATQNTASVEDISDHYCG